DSAAGPFRLRRGEVDHRRGDLVRPGHPPERALRPEPVPLSPHLRGGREASMRADPPQSGQPGQPEPASPDPVPPQPAWPRAGWPPQPTRPQTWPEPPTVPARGAAAQPDAWPPQPPPWPQQASAWPQQPTAQPPQPAGWPSQAAGI